VTLRLPDRVLRLPASTEEAVRALLTGQPYRVSELPGLVADDALVLVRRLLKDAVVVPVRPVA
jgi:lysine-specific demethylase/histidyl-hydroxylase NO66